MTDKGMQEKYKRDLKLARERHGKPSEAQNAERKERMRLRKAVLEALVAGPKTVPELAAEIGADARECRGSANGSGRLEEIATGESVGHRYS